MKRVSALLFALSAIAASPAIAQNAKPTQLIVPFAAGGAQDAMGRYFGAKLAAKLGNPVIIDNKGGAGGVIAADGVAKATPDGSNLLLATGGAITILPNIRKDMAYDPLKDLMPVALLADTPMTLSVRTESPYKTIGDLLADAKARPGAITFASSGNGSVSNLTGELLSLNAGIQLLHVPYRGAAPALTDMISGQVDSIVISVASIEPLAAAGKVRVLATFTAAPIPSLKAPTLREATGIAGLEVPVWAAIMAPAKTPAAVVDKLAATLTEICNEAETKERMEKLGAVATCGGPADADKVIREDFDRWKKVIATGKVKAE